MLHRPKLKTPPTPLAYWGTAGNATASLRIEITGVDPRLILVPRLWVERTDDGAGPEGVNAAVSAHVNWSAYSATENSRGDLIGLNVINGALLRPVRPADGFPGGDGVLIQGDNLEIQASTSILIGINLTDTGGEIPTYLKQGLWFALDVYTSEPFDPDAYHNLVEQIRVTLPRPLEMLSRWE